MYAITYKEKPVTLEYLDQLEQRAGTSRYEADQYITAKTRPGAISAYLHRYGFKWNENFSIGL